MPIDHASLRCTFIDHEGEACSFKVPVAEMDATTLAAGDAQLDACKTALRALMIAPAEQADTRVYAVESLYATKPVNPLCQRENKWQITGRDQLTHTIRRIEVPCADLTILEPNQDIVDLTAGPGLAVKQALDACWISVETGNLVVVTEIRNVSRNL